MLEIFGFFMLALVCYNIPSIIAVSRYHNSAMKILIINILFGWTIIGWLIAFIWSLLPPGAEE